MHCLLPTVSPSRMPASLFGMGRREATLAMVSAAFLEVPRSLASNDVNTTIPCTASRPPHSSHTIRDRPRPYDAVSSPPQGTALMSVAPACCKYGNNTCLTCYQLDPPTRPTPTAPSCRSFFEIGPYLPAP